MKKRALSDFDKDTISRIVIIAQEEKRPFEVIKNDFGLGKKNSPN